MIALVYKEQMYIQLRANDSKILVISFNFFHFIFISMKDKSGFQTAEN